MLGLVLVGLAACGGSTKSSVQSIQGMSDNRSADVIVYGATPSGIAAAIEAAHLGKRVLLLEAGQHIGGMSTNGLGRTDLYNMRALGGLVLTFFQTVHAIYGPTERDDGLGTMYEPHVAEQAFRYMLEQQHTLTLMRGVSLEAVTMGDRSIKSVRSTNGLTYQAKMFIDASYEGDLLAAAGVSYVTGRESAQQYGESLAGVQPPRLPAGLTVDPYLIAGDPSSGLLPHIESRPLAMSGVADDGMMSYNFRLCVSNDPNNQISFTAPPGYDAHEFEALGRWTEAFVLSGKPLDLSDFIFLSQLPNKKFDLNNSGAALAAVLSTDDVGANRNYVMSDASGREQIAREHRRYMQGLLYFIRGDSRVPDPIRRVLSTYGLCKDEFTDNGGWPHQLYIREARRMQGAYVMTQHDIERQTTIADPIGFGGYNMDSHLVHRVAINGSVNDEGANFAVVTVPYPISYRALTPQATQAKNLLVSVAASASHIAYESMRMEPTYMIMGQAAGAAASLAIDENTTVQNVDYAALASQLHADGQVLDCCTMAKLRAWWHQISRHFDTIHPE